MSASRRAISGSLFALVLAAGVAGCGGDDPATAGPLAEDMWRERAIAFCSDALQEATALPVPGSVAELAPDAAARAEIVASLRDGLLTLGQPEDISPEDVSAYVAELTTDEDVLSRLSEAAGSGADVQELLGQVDESSGEIAARLDLPECAAVANAIARTP